MTNGLTKDNRDSAEIFGYYESRIDAMKRTIKQVQAENNQLRTELRVREEIIAKLLKGIDRDAHLGATEMGG